MDRGCEIRAHWRVKPEHAFIVKVGGLRKAVKSRTVIRNNKGTSLVKESLSGRFIV